MSPVPQAVPKPDPVELSVLLQALVRDPSLRQSALGRRLLHLLHSCSMMTDDWRTLIDVVPPHRLDTVAVVARQCAESWERFSRALQERTSQDAPDV